MITRNSMLTREALLKRSLAFLLSCAGERGERVLDEAEAFTLVGLVPKAVGRNVKSGEDEEPGFLKGGWGRGGQDQECFIKISIILPE